MLPKKLIGMRVGKRPFNLPSLGGPQRAVLGDGCLPNLVVQWLGPHLPVQGVGGSVPGQRTKIPHALRSKNQNIRQKQYCNAFNKDFKNWSTSKNKTTKKKWPSVGPRWGHWRAWHVVGLTKRWINQPVSGSLPRNSPHPLSR